MFHHEYMVSLNLQAKIKKNNKCLLLGSWNLLNTGVRIDLFM